MWPLNIQPSTPTLPVTVTTGPIKPQHNHTLSELSASSLRQLCTAADFCPACSTKISDPVEEPSQDPPILVQAGSKRSFACPYYIHDSEAHQDCANKVLTRIVDVRLHIKRTHLKDYCPICGDTIPQDPEHTRWDAHISAQSCERRPLNFICATLDQCKQMSNLGSAKDDEDRYNRIYKIIFPHDELPASPYTTVFQVDIRDAITDYAHSAAFMGHLIDSIPPALMVHLTNSVPHESREYLAQLLVHLAGVPVRMLDNFASYAGDRLKRHPTHEQTGNPNSSGLGHLTHPQVDGPNPSGPVHCAQFESDWNNITAADFLRNEIPGGAHHLSTADFGVSGSSSNVFPGNFSPSRGYFGASADSFNTLESDSNASMGNVESFSQCDNTGVGGDWTGW